VEATRPQRLLILFLGTILLIGTGAARAAPLAPGGRSLAGAAPSPASGPAGGAAAAFGENYFGELGTFYKDKYEPSPVPVEGLTNIIEVAGSASFNLALLSDGTVASWGGNGHGQLGDNRKRPNWEEGAGHALVEEESPSTHEVTGGLHGVRAVAVANEHAMALMDDGTVMAWGNDEYGQLGNGTQGFERQLNINERLPKAVPGLQNITAIAAGGGSDYALTSAGTVLAWGNNTQGQLGLGRPGPDHCETAVAHSPHYELCSERPLPVVWTNPATGRLEELTEVQAVYAGAFAAFALLPGGRLVSWGGNRHGELGTGAETWPGSELPPAEVRRVDGSPLTNVAELAPGFSFALARLEDGEVLGWGSAAQGDLAGERGEECPPEAAQQASGSSNRRSCVKLATRLPALEGLHPEALSAGRHYGLALAAGAVYAWGSNERGQLGSGKVPRSGRAKRAGNPTPKQVAGIGPAAAVLAAGTHSVVLLGSGVAPPAPLVSAVPEHLAVKLSWEPETATGQALVGERLLYRVSERTGEPEPAEQGSSEGEEGPPVNNPEEPVYLTLDGEPIGSRPLVVGDKLTAEPGGWSGARPITFAYQWQRCNAEGEACSDILGAHHPGYFLVEADTGSTVRAIVTATGPEAKGTAASAASAPVNSGVEGEGTRNAATIVKLSRGLLGFEIDRTIEKASPSNGERHPRETSRPLQAVPYEVKFTASKQVRVMVLTPLE
jgi:Regulator of chromosome condensation (RCC1) repeat